MNTPRHKVKTPYLIFPTPFEVGHYSYLPKEEAEAWRGPVTSAVASRRVRDPGLPPPAPPRPHLALPLWAVCGRLSHSLLLRVLVWTSDTGAGSRSGRKGGSEWRTEEERQREDAEEGGREEGRRKEREKERLVSVENKPPWG